ncbi:MAG TPA: hypothetical protein VMG59_06875 [Phycisphaerae bacterium]|nr:hypothetical protein [Phycisphaerae bacterium]
MGNIDEVLSAAQAEENQRRDDAWASYWADLKDIAKGVEIDAKRRERLMQAAKVIGRVEFLRTDAQRMVTLHHANSELARIEHRNLPEEKKQIDAEKARLEKEHADFVAKQSPHYQSLAARTESYERDRSARGQAAMTKENLERLITGGPDGPDATNQQY